MASQYGDSYEEWKAQGRPGGSYASWLATQAPQDAPPPPGGAPPPPPPGAPPQSSPYGDLSGFRTYADWQAANRAAGGSGQSSEIQKLYQGGSNSQDAPVPGGQGLFSQAWMDEALKAYAAGQRGSDPLRTPGFDPNTFRQNYAGQAGGNRPEDLARFSNETLAGWMPFYDPATGKYRSMRGAEGWFDKPTECPPGTGPSGPNETDPCTATGYSQPNPWERGATQPAPAAPVSPLKTILTPLQGQGAPAPPLPPVAPPGPPGTTPYEDRGGVTGLPPVAPPGRGGVPGKTPALQTLLTPLNTGAPAPQGGLTNMLTGRQRRPGQWF